MSKFLYHVKLQKDHLNKLRILCCNSRHSFDRDANKNLRNLLQLQQLRPNVAQNSIAQKYSFKRFKELTLKYWYAVLPIHVINSILWFGGCYYLAAQGFDVVGLLKKLNVSQRMIDFLTDSKTGQLTLSLAIYKLFTPFRCVTTFISSTIVIHYLGKTGLVKTIKHSSEKNKRC